MSDPKIVTIRRLTGPDRHETNTPVGSRDESPNEKARAEARALLTTALDAPPLTDKQKATAADLRTEFTDLAEHIILNVPHSRRRSLALTHLETALMFTNKALFND